MALITDGRFSGGTHGFVVGHITPEAFVGGPLALVKNGDPITIDARRRTLDARRPGARTGGAPAGVAGHASPATTRGVLAKYARLVSTASDGRGHRPRRPRAVAPSTS